MPGGTKWLDSPNQEARGEGAHVEGHTGLAAGTRCLVPHHFKVMSRYTSSLQVPGAPDIKV